MDTANSHTKSYNILRSLEAMHMNIKHELRAWVTCVLAILCAYAFFDFEFGSWTCRGVRSSFAVALARISSLITK